MIFQNFISLSLFSSINEGQKINSAVDELIDKHSEGIFVIDFVCNLTLEFHLYIRNKSID